MARPKGRYCIALLTREFIEIERSQAMELGKTVTPEWPIAFTKLTCSAEEFLSSFPCNHIHGVYGDYTKELIAAGKIMDIETRLFGAAPGPPRLGDERGVE